MKVTIDHELCSLCELCVSSCPDVFKVIDDKVYAEDNFDEGYEVVEESKP